MSYNKSNSSKGFGPHIIDGVPGAGTDEVQTITFAGTISGGTFKLGHEGLVTAAITWSSTDATLVANIDAALEALGSIGTGGVVTADSTLTSGIGDATVTFGGNRAKQNVGPLSVVANNLTGSGASVSVATTTPGVDADFRGAPKGALVIDATNGKLYINTGTALAPTWTVVGTQT